jgi:hypothetical protein
MVDAESPDQRFVRLDRQLRRARALAIGALVLAGGALVFALLPPRSLTIGDVTIDGHQISVRNGDRVSGISAGSVWTVADTRAAWLGPATLDLRITHGAEVKMWASEHSTKLSLGDPSSDTIWQVGTSPHAVAAP